jgi:nucleotide-binding universal stress UspA family protein
MVKLNSILVPIDFSDISLKAAQYGAEMARALGGRLFIFHVINQRIIDLTQELSLKGFYDQEFKEVLNSMVQERKNDMSAFLSDSWLEGIDVEFDIRKGKPADEIINFAREKHIDLIVVGTVGKSTLQVALTGSVARNLVNHAPCPVIVWRPGEQDFIK